MGTELPVWFTNSTVLIFGLIIGSFLNVVIFRLPAGKSLIQPGSQCSKCKKPVRWYDNVPVVSYLILAGKCRNCSSRISIQYPVVELVTAMLFLAAKIRFGWSWLLWVHDFPFLAILIAITFIDLEHRLIPDELSLGGLGLGLLTTWLVPGVSWIQPLIGAAIGFSLFYGFAWIYFKMTGRSGLGGGDIKLLAMLGAFLGPLGVFTTVLMSSILGSVIGVAWALATQRKKAMMKVAIPYGPFLVLGALYYYLLGDLIWLPFTIPT